MPDQNTTTNLQHVHSAKAQVRSASKMTVFFPYFAFLLQKRDFIPLPHSIETMKT